MFVQPFLAEDCKDYVVLRIMYSKRMVDAIDILTDERMLEIFWNEFGFGPWAGFGLHGVSRRVTFRKDSLMGEVARYYSDDYIIYSPDNDRYAMEILGKWKPVNDVMSHRVLLVGNSTWQKPLHKDFLFGFSGWVEVFAYRLGDPPPVRKYSDLSALLNNAAIVLGKLEQGVNPVKERIRHPGRRGVPEGEPRRPVPLEGLKKLFRR